MACPAGAFRTSTVNPLTTTATRPSRIGALLPCAVGRFASDATPCRRGGCVALLTLGQAARLTGHNKTTLSRAIKAGRLSGTRRGDGAYLIDVAELERVYTIKAQTDAAPAA